MSKTIWITGIPRSGSTWAYNIVREFLSLEGDGFYKYRKQRDSKRLQIFKVHEPTDIDMHDLVIHSTRPYQEALDSLKVMEPLNQAEVQDLRTWDNHWQRRATVTFARHQIDSIDGKKAVAARIRGILHRVMNTWSIPFEWAVVHRVERYELPSPDQYADPVTLLHHNHFTRVEECAEKSGRD